ncbi:MAG: PilZ domain-containing protein [Planctomycetota bacterium]
MHDQERRTSIEGRRLQRVEIDEPVTIRFEAGAISGSGQNISAQGVFFTADGSLPVTMAIAGKGEVRGHVVRLESLGDGRFGVAVRFDADAPSLVPAT